MIISVTGLRTHSLWGRLRFYWLAIPAFRQAKLAKGNLFCETRKIDGVYHTLTAWKSRKHMKHYVLSGAHRTAMGQFSQFATGAVHSFESETMPSWERAVQNWREAAASYD